MRSTIRYTISAILFAIALFVQSTLALGAIFAYWTIESLLTGDAWLIETVYKDYSPARYWFAVVLWAVASLVAFCAYFILGY